jgi:hypothetical protein
MIVVPKNHDHLFGVKSVVAFFFLSVAINVLEPIPRLWPWGLASPVSIQMSTLTMMHCKESVSGIHASASLLFYKWNDLLFGSFLLIWAIIMIIFGTDGKLQKLVERVRPGEEPLLKGAETIVFGKDGTLFALTEEGKLVSFTEFETQGTNSGDDAKIDILITTAKSTLVANLGVGRPLSGSFDNQNTFYIADAHLGLTRLKNPGNPGSSLLRPQSSTTENGPKSTIAMMLLLVPRQEWYTLRIVSVHIHSFG